MKAPQIWRLERMVFNGFRESGSSAARKRKSDSDSPVKAFVETVPQTADPILTLLRFEAFIKGWQSTIDYDRENEGPEADFDIPSPREPGVFYGDEPDPDGVS